MRGLDIKWPEFGRFRSERAEENEKQSESYKGKHSRKIRHLDWRKVDIKQIIMYAVAFVCGKFCVGGSYPLVSAIFMIGFLSGVNRSILFLGTLAGMILFLPVLSLIKYSFAIMLAALLVKGVEWYRQSCSCMLAAVFAGGSTCLMTLLGTAIHMKTVGGPGVAILEGLFVAGFVHAFGRYGYLFLEWKPLASEPAKILVGGSARLAGYAESFEKLAKTFGQMNRYKEDFTAEELSRMQAEVTGRICVSCGQCAVCWENENPPMYQVLYRFLQKLQRGTSVSESAGELKEHCLYSEELMDQVLQIFEKARLNMAWYNRLQENREVIAQQLDAMAYIMEDCARENEDISSREGKLLATVKYTLRENGILIESLKLLCKANGKKVFYLQAAVRNGRCISAREIAKKISSCAGTRYISVRENPTILGENLTVMSFQEDSRYAAYHGIARIVKEGEQLSGDSFSFQQLEDGRFVMSLSDGMGSGVSAAKESETVIDLLEKFLEAGFCPETAIRMMNSAMVTHGDHNLFSTVDVMETDLDTGLCRFYKIGAADTYIKRGAHIEVLTCDNPPIGVFSQMKLDCQEYTLQSGDFVIMISDGVTDHLHVPDPMETMTELLQTLDGNNPKQMAKQILERILLYTGGSVKDDMTVLVTGIWEKEQ